VQPDDHGEFPTEACDLERERSYDNGDNQACDQRTLDRIERIHTSPLCEIIGEFLQVLAERPDFLSIFHTAGGGSDAQRVEE
jgi:hypothetical protein